MLRHRPASNGHHSDSDAFLQSQLLRPWTQRRGDAEASAEASFEVARFLCQLGSDRVRATTQNLNAMTRKTRARTRTRSGPSAISEFATKPNRARCRSCHGAADHGPRTTGTRSRRHGGELGQDRIEFVRCFTNAAARFLCQLGSDRVGMEGTRTWRDVALARQLVAGRGQSQIFSNSRRKEAKTQSLFVKERD